MASRRKTPRELNNISRAPARTPEERENQLVELAVNLTEQQMLDGTASAQQVTHFLKLGSSRERLEQKRLENEVALLQTKREVMESEKRVEELIGQALKAMQAYSGNLPDQAELEYDEYE